MKISQIMLSKDFGGAERYFLDLSLALADAGHHVQVVCHRDFVARPLLEARQDIELHCIPVWGKWDPVAPWRLVRILRAFQPDVVHAHLARGAFMAGKAVRKTRYPLVVKTHNYVDLKYYRDVDHFIATTQDQCRYLTSHGIPAERISVIPNFSRIPPVANARSGIPDSATIVAFGRMVEKKGFDLLLKAFAKLLSKGFTPLLLIGGDGPERARLEQLAQSLGIEDRVRFPGWIKDVPAFLSNGDLFVLPSRDEPFGIAVIEAMASGLPIIATRTKGPLEILDESTACLVPANDVEALYTAMADTLNQPELSSRIATTALDLYIKRYHESAVLPQLLALYQAMRKA